MKKPRVEILGVAALRCIRCNQNLFAFKDDEGNTGTSCCCHHLPKRATPEWLSQAGLSEELSS